MLFLWKGKTEEMVKKMPNSNKTIFLFLFAEKQRK